MTVKLENELLVVTIAEQGAELISLKSKQTELEYMWQGNPEFWGRHAPVLFPIVGRLKEDKYSYEGQTYSMSQHGFARDQVFTVIEKGEQSVSLSLKSTPETKKMYPFEFELILSYELKEAELLVGYQVQNIDTKEMYFSIGGHPAFNVPLEEHLDFSDYYLSFSPQKSRVQIPLNGPYADFEHKTLGQTNTSLDLKRELFTEDALIFETIGCNTFTIASDESAHSVHLSFSNMPYVGIWSPYPKDAPFVCIEPWCGIADDVQSNGQLVDKIGINRLAPDEVFHAAYTIAVE